MKKQTLNHKNYESDTVHGHAFHEAEKHMRDSKVTNESSCENRNKLCEEYEEREMRKEKESVVKKAEYRDFLLQQMSDKEKLNKSPVIISSLTPFSEELLNATEKSDLKLQKQKEAKENLDECIKMKEDQKLRTRRVELEEDQKITEFWKKRDDDNINTMEKVKQQSQRKENTKNEVALLWQAEKRKDIQREKFIDSLIGKDSIADLNKHQKELIEKQKLIRTKKELLKKNDEKIEEWLKNVEITRKVQDELKNEIEREEEMEQELKLRNSALENSMANNKTDQCFDEVDRRKKVLQERNYQCANNRFFGID